MGSLIFKAILKYIESNPGVIDELVHLAFGEIIASIKAHQGKVS